MDDLYKSQSRKDIITDLMLPLMGNSPESTVSVDAFSIITDQCYLLLMEIISNAKCYKYKTNDHKLRLEHVVSALTESPFFYPGSSLISRNETVIRRKDIFAEPKIHLNGQIKGHWLVIEGVQPITAFNPVDSVRKEAMEAALLQQPPTKRPKCICDSKTMRTINSLTAYKIKPTDSHIITAEEQLFFVELTKTLVGVNDSKRMDSLSSLSNDPMVSSIMAPLVVFISQATRENISTCNFPILIYIIRVIHAVVRNPHIYVEQYLHELLPCVLSCIVTKEVCSARDFGSQWALRDFAVNTLRMIVRGFDSEVNQMKNRVSRVLEKVLKNPKSSIPACYGATHGLFALGHDAVDKYLMPHVGSVVDRICDVADSAYPDSADRVAGDKYVDFLKKTMSDEIMQNVSKERESEYLKQLGGIGPVVAASIRERTYIVR